MIKHQAFLSLEASLADKLSESLRLFVAPLYKDIEGALGRQDYAEADRLARSIDLRPMMDEVRPYVLWISNLSMLFGASRVTSRPGTSVVGMGYEKLAVQQFVDTFLNTSIATAGDYLTTQAVQIVATQAGQPVQKAEIDLSELVSYDPKASVLRPFASFMDAQGKAYFNLVSSLHNSRVSAYGFTAEAAALGLEEYTINEQLDNRVCPVCSEMHGRVFRVQAARALLDVVLRVNDKQDLKHLQPWPKQDQQSLEELKAMGDDELVGRGWHLPPYHPRCRGLLSRVGKQPPLKAIQAGTVADSTSYKAVEAEFEAMGMSTSSARLQAWEKAVKVAPSEVVSVFKGQPVDMFFEGLLKTDNVQQYVGTKVTYGTGTVHLNIKQEFGKAKEQVSAKLKFDSEQKTLHVKALTIGDEKTYNPKTLKKLMQGLYTIAQDGEMDTLSLDAKNFGGYAWAKAGFKPNPHEWWALKKYINQALMDAKVYETASITVLKALQGILSSDDPSAIFALADLGDVGKKALTNAKWHAQLSLTDSEAVGRFLVFFGD